MINLINYKSLHFSARTIPNCSFFIIKSLKARFIPKIVNIYYALVENLYPLFPRTFRAIL